ncbi:MAG: purine-nucleoside phosphorylase [Micrococcales bacterium]|nr:MAG: purine-nucleoside phosphorylase [Micrococcales bacterium]PIE28005.1 MAG: purine-nucleoside phosphorylase [Micrococcales bacterium]
MSTHIGAQAGQIAPIVLMPGDPLRAKWIAENFLSEATCYTQVRGMLGFTGTYDGHRVSVQGSGMGMPSFSIYGHELFAEYDVQSIIRVGSCGALTEELKVRDLVMATATCTDSNMNRVRFSGLDYAPAASYELLRAAMDAAAGKQVRAKAGLVFSADQFYNPRPELLQTMVEYGVLAVEMEAAALYTLAAKFSRQALAICTVSDHIVTGEETSAQEREQTFGDMIDIALRAALAG